MKIDVCKDDFISCFAVDGMKRLSNVHTDSHGQEKEAVWIFCKKVSVVECKKMYDHRRYVGLFFIDVTGAHGVLGLADFWKAARFSSYNLVVSWF